MALADRLKVAFGVVGAGRVLTNADKRVWEKHGFMDQKGLGTEVSATTMGLLLGMGSETVEQSRRRLLRVGLLQRSEGRGCRTRWYVRFPEGWVPKLGARPRAEDYAAAADIVDKLISAALAGDREEVPRESRPRPRDSHQQYQQVEARRIPGQGTGFQHISSLASVRGEGEGGGAPQGLVSERQPLPAVAETSGGGGSLIEKDGGGETAVDRGDWRAVLRPGRRPAAETA